MGDDQSYSDIFDKIDTLLDDVDITATTKIIQSTTKAPIIQSKGNRNLISLLSQERAKIYNAI